MTMTPAQAWQQLQSGNERFIAGDAQHPHQDVDRRNDLAHTQNPIVAVFGCSDSRLAAEIIFDLGLGDAFVIRNAGQVVSDSALGSIEYAVGLLHTPLLLVLGHDECGAVRAAIDSRGQDAPALPPQIAHLIEPIAPAVRRVTNTTAGQAIDPESVDAAAVGREHLRDTVTELLQRSELLSYAIAEGNLAIVGANYRLREGRAVPDVLIGLD